MRVTHEESPVAEIANRKTWPYPKMKVGETVRIHFDKDDAASDQRYARSYAHSHGYKTGKRFRTAMDGNTLVVTRVE